MTHNIDKYIDANLNDAMTIRAYGADAQEAMRKGKTGWPTSTPGANPQTAGASTSSETYTSTERAALLTPDKAAQDEAAFIKAIHAAQKNNAIAATIAQRWAIPSLDGTTIRDRLAAIDAGIWCNNHQKYHMNEPRRQGGPTCDFCYDFATRYKRAAPVEVLDYRARYGRLTEMQINRLLDQAKTREKEARKANKKENSAA